MGIVTTENGHDLKKIAIELSDLNISPTYTSCPLHPLLTGHVAHPKGHVRTTPPTELERKLIKLVLEEEGRHCTHSVILWWGWG